MSTENIKDLENKLVGASTLGELAALVIAKIDIEKDKPEWIHRDQVKSIFCIDHCSSPTYFNNIIRWGKENGYQVRRRGSKVFNRADADKLTAAFWAVNSTAKVY